MKLHSIVIPLVIAAMHVPAFGADSPKHVNIILWRMAAWEPIWIAAGVVVLLFGIVLAIALWGSHKHAIGKQNQISILTRFFYDPTSKSYSLSAFQFYLWTAAAAFGYLYLALARSFVQGASDLPKTDTLPIVLLASAGTVIIATGVGYNKPKGAGAPKPSISDFVTSGGLVVPERVQYVVWTLVGLILFLSLVVSSDPATIDKLPSLPDGLVMLMGISSAGYLAGKLTRAAGPVITMVKKTLPAAPGPGALVVEVQGTKLSSDARLEIDNNRIDPAWLPQRASDKTYAPEVVTGEDDVKFAKLLKFTIDGVTTGANGVMTLPSGATINPNKTPPPRVAIINSDAQRAEQEV